MKSGKKIFALLLAAFMLLAGAASAGADGNKAEKEASQIDYLALVNKLNPMPENWEDALVTTTIVNSVGDEVEVETKAYRAYLLLKADLEENNGIGIELDSARRSVAAQQDIMDRFTEKYGADYAAKTVAAPGYSEHHTGLALDLYFRLKNENGEWTDVYYNEDMVLYPELWAQIHAKLADYGFILRYLDGREHITGYGYEPWHIRFVDSTDMAKDIMKQGLTLEEYLGGTRAPEVALDYGESELYRRDELIEAAVQIKCDFAKWAGCELHSLRYAGDDQNNEENISWLNSLSEGSDYSQIVCFTGSFHTPAEQSRAWEPDEEYSDYRWWLARGEDGGWELVTAGTCRDLRDGQLSCAEPADTGETVLDRIRTRGVLRVGSAGDYQPMSYLDPETGEYVGFDAELAKDLVAALGVEIEYVTNTSHMKSGSKAA